MFNSQAQKLGHPPLETKHSQENQSQTSLNASPEGVQTSELIEAVKQNNQQEFDRLLLKTNPSGNWMIDEVDSEYHGSALYWAAACGHAHFIAPLAKAGAGVNKPGNRNITPVFIAAEKGYADAITELRRVGAEMNTPNEDGWSPVFVAAMNGHAAAITALKTSGADVNTPHNDSGATPVYVAARDGHIDAIRALAGANVDTPDSDGATPVYTAARNGRANAISVLKALGANVDTPNNSGATPVYAAASKGQVEAIRALKAAGANVDTPKANGWTPAHIAARDGNVEAIRALKAAGAAMDTSNNDGETPAYIAACNGRTTTIDALYIAGANMNTPNNNGETPVYTAACNGYARTIMALKAAGANVSTPNRNNVTPIYIAAEEGHAEVISTLKALGANVDTPCNGITPMAIAVQKRHIDAIRALITAGANVNAPGKAGQTPLSIAASTGEITAVIALLEAGADASVNTPHGRPLEQAKKSKDPRGSEVFKLLEAHLRQYPNGIKPVMGSAPASVTFHTRRPSVKLNLADEKNEQEKVRRVLEELRTFFIEDRYLGEKTENYATYNEYLKKANRGVQLAYKPTQNKHLLYVNGKPVEDADTAAQELSKMIDALASTNPSESKEALEREEQAFKKQLSEMQQLMEQERTKNEKRIADMQAETEKAKLKETDRMRLDMQQLMEQERIKNEKRIADMQAETEKAKLKEVDRMRLDMQQMMEQERIKNEKRIADMQAQMEKLSRPSSIPSGQPAPPLTPQYSSKSAPVVNASDLKDLQEFLRLVAEGEQDKAEAMLKSNPALALVPGDVTDLSKRTFNNITGFQYAVWALDWHMWSMIRKYLPDEAAKEQAQGFETGSWVKTHGVHANLNTLIQAYQTTLDLYKASKYAEGDTAWVKQVGGAQLLLPAHVINEYCHPTRPMYPTPNFKDALVLPRSRKIDLGEWFTAPYNGGRQREKYGVYRGPAGLGRGAQRGGRLGGLGGLSLDHDSVRALTSARTAQREELITELMSRNTQRKAA